MARADRLMWPAGPWGPARSGSVRLELTIREAFELLWLLRRIALDEDGHVWMLREELNSLIGGGE